MSSYCEDTKYEDGHSVYGDALGMKLLGVGMGDHCSVHAISHLARKMIGLQV